MLELANTSLPNGLIPGTHGFATVAMTRGIPDALRVRLEAFCAYTHKSSAHDDTYRTQNPVNWFHAILPQGGHVLGRVAASDFDYTGRTNRLARLLVLRPQEMPRCGAAAILAAETGRLSEPWTGEPRHLSEDRDGLRRIAALAAPLNPVPRNWIALFGAEGATLAKRVARQLEKNIPGGRRPIYFKTSTTFDPDGTRLLALFSDVIGLLPQESRASVTFSTYPDALPGGTGCLLRGAFEGDKLFAAASATQAWIDCPAGRVVHAELLPEAETKPASTSMVSVAGRAPQGTATKPAMSTASSPVGGPRPSTNATQARRSKASFLNKAEQERNADRKFYTILAACAAIVIVAFAIGAVIMLNNQRKQRTEENQRLAEDKREKEEARRQFEKGQQELKEREEERKRKEEEIRQAADRAKDAQRIEVERRHEDSTIKVETAETKPGDVQQDDSSRKDDCPAFCHATKLEIIDINKLNASDFMEAHPKMSAFLYSEEPSLLWSTNVVVKPIPDGAGKSFRPAHNKIANKNCGHFTIYYDAEKKEAFWLWKEWPKDAKKGELWFENAESHDLWRDIFGGEDNVGKFFKSMAGTPIFTIVREETGEKIGVTEREISTQRAKMEDFKPSLGEKDVRVGNPVKIFVQTNEVLKSSIEGVTDRIEKRKNELKDMAQNGHKNDLTKLMEEDNALTKLKDEKNTLDSEMRKAEDQFKEWWSPEVKKAKYAITGVKTEGQ